MTLKQIAIFSIFAIMTDCIDEKIDLLFIVAHGSRGHRSYWCRLASQIVRRCLVRGWVAVEGTKKPEGGAVEGGCGVDALHVLCVCSRRNGISM
jgi:hypothetical protein